MALMLRPYTLSFLSQHYVASAGTCPGDPYSVSVTLQHIFVTFV